MFNRKKKELNVSLTTFSLVTGAVLGFAYALLSTKQTGKELQKDLRRKADKALKNSKRKIGKEFVKAKREFGSEFETQMTKTLSNIKDSSKKVWERIAN